MKKVEGSIEQVEKCCDIHGKYQAKIIEVLGKSITSKCKKCLKAQCENDNELKNDDLTIQKRLKIETLFNDASIPLRFKNKNFDSYEENNKNAELALAICKKYANDFDSRFEAGGGIVMCGNCGTGKTHLAAAITNEVISKHQKSVLFISVMQAIRRVKETYSQKSDETEGQAIAAFSLPDLLIIDEVGVQFGSNTEKMILFEIINNRYQEMLPTILISNLNLKELSNYVGERIVDRMREGGGAVISFDWCSYRDKK